MIFKIILKIFFSAKTQWFLLQIEWGIHFFWSHGSEKSTFFRIWTFSWLSAWISHFFDQKGHNFDYFFQKFWKKFFPRNRVILVVNWVRNPFFLVPWLYKNQFFQNLNFSERCQKETFLRNIDGLKFFRKIFFRWNTVILM